jgi:succinate dehydrogenase/fumarate reductase flavoprotein subunit
MTAARQEATHRHRGKMLDLTAEVLVIGGGPAAAWAAVAAAAAGARIVLVDKGNLGTSGATSPSNTGTWFVPPGGQRRAAIDRRLALTHGLAESASRRARPMSSARCRTRHR